MRTAARRQRCHHSRFKNIADTSPSPYALTAEIPYYLYYSQVQYEARSEPVSPRVTEGGPEPKNVCPAVAVTGIHVTYAKVSQHAECSVRIQEIWLPPGLCSFAERGQLLRHVGGRVVTTGIRPYARCHTPHAQMGGISGGCRHLVCSVRSHGPPKRRTPTNASGRILPMSQIHMGLCQNQSGFCTQESESRWPPWDSVLRPPWDLTESHGDRPAAGAPPPSTLQHACVACSA
eukprot:COSAG02_NODE_1294_length_13401_cov_32.784393_2_plen_233_part_00